MRRAVSLLLAAAFIFLTSCLPDVKIDKKEDKNEGQLYIIYEEKKYSYGYRIAGQPEKVCTELCEIKGDKTEVLFSLKGEQTVSIIESYGRVGNYMYFQANTGDWEHTLLVYNRSTGLTKILINYPSSNMLVLSAESEYGYVLHESVVVAVDLDNAAIDESESWTMENNMKFFYQDSDQFYKRSSKLNGIDERTIQIQVGTFQSENSAVPEESLYYQFDTLLKTMWGPY